MPEWNGLAKQSNKRLKQFEGSGHKQQSEILSADGFLMLQVDFRSLKPTASRSRVPLRWPGGNFDHDSNAW